MQEYAMQEWAKCPYYSVLYIQSVLVIQYFIILCQVSLLCSALYAKCPYYSVLYNNMQSALIM